MNIDRACAPHETVLRADRSPAGGYDRLRSVIGTDPLLRLYAALPGDSPGTTWPAHPGFPDGTTTVSIATMTASPARFQATTGDRWQWPVHPLWAFTEYVIRPLMTAFRVALDRYDTLLDTDPRHLALEVTGAGRATGRVVVTGVVAPSAGDVHRAARDLANALGLLTESATATLPRWQLPRHVHAHVWRIVEQELRFLRPETAALLRGGHPLGQYVHSVPDQHDHALRQVLKLVAERDLRRRTDPALPPPAVLVNLDGSLPAGLGRFVRDVEDHGGTVTFGAAAHQRERIKDALAQCGLPRPLLLTGARRVEDFAAVVDRPDTLERNPHPSGPPHDCRLSHGHSIAELPVGDLRVRPVVAEHAVRLSAADSAALVDGLVRGAREAAHGTAERALRTPAPAGETSHERALRLVCHILTRKQFRRGSRGAYPMAVAARDMMPAIRRGEPIRMVLPAFPVKQADSGLKAFGTLPDLAELALLVRLLELGTALAGVYPPGARITLLTDGNHFRVRPRALTGAYLRRIAGYLRLIGGEPIMELEDVDLAAARLLGADAVRARPGLLTTHRRALEHAYRDLDITEDPVGVLARSRALDPAGPGASGVTVADMCRSLVHSVRVQPPYGTDRREWSALLYADLYNVGDAVAPMVAQGRREILRGAWAAALRYVAVNRTDQDLGYDRMFAPRVRLTLSTSVPGRCGFAGLGGSAVPPWQGTAAVDAHGHVSTDFAIHLLDQGFVPVHSPLQGGDQPWFMAPVTALRPAAPARLEPGHLDRVRLRSR
ncbi:L-tyrosine/L-tryptophan isonitrile synthase family protein [Nonomuraea sp. NPDC050643]|uniref:L-tyrosine/L-tryptophan isonitrile synthase family protein n=1 Tax=Nonomuraea sp. NPDC050643 TaxID=3155660 RepID=UPI0034116DDD